MDLNELMDEAQASERSEAETQRRAFDPANRLQPLTVDKPPVQKLNYSHDAMIDMIIAHPEMSQNDIARRFGYSASWVSTIMCSDAFQAKLADRANEILTPELRFTVKERFEGMLKRSIEVINSKLDKPMDQISPQFALRTFELASRAAGYGARVDTQPPVTQQSVHIHLDAMADGLTKLLNKKRVEQNVLEDSSDE